MSELVRYDVADGIATITLDSPANRNALSDELLRSLRSCLAGAVADDAVRVIVLSHTGTVFCSGMDLRAVGDVPAAEQPVVAFPALLTDIVDAPKPVLARVAGKARAGGIGLLAACDLAIGSVDVDFAFTEVRLGLVPAVISVPVLRRMAAQPAHRLFLTGEVFGAGLAAAIGLLDAAVPAADLDAEVARFAGMLAAGGPYAVAATKSLLTDPPTGSLAERFDQLAALSARHFADAEGQEGIAARAEKRPARWVPAR